MAGLRQVYRTENTLPQLGFESRTVRPAACRNTDYAIAVTCNGPTVLKTAGIGETFVRVVTIWLTDRPHIYVLANGDTPNCSLQPSCAPNNL
jgi:hypothetical protein